MYMERVKEQILEEHQLPTSSSTCDPTPSTYSPTCDHTTSTSSHARRSNDTYVYCVGMLAVFAIVASVFLHITVFNLKIKRTCQ